MRLRSPAKIMEMLKAIHDQRWSEAENIRTRFEPLEDLRNAIQPIRVLHRAVELAGIAQTVPCNLFLVNCRPMSMAVFNRLLKPFWLGTMASSFENLPQVK